MKDEGQLPFTNEVAQRTNHLYERVRGVVSQEQWHKDAPYIDAINRLKSDLNAVILAHNYQIPTIFHCVADLTGDSLALARMAEESDAEIIVMCGVHFMAETAKLLNPSRTVLIPDVEAGCSLADAIGPEDVRALKAAHPGVPVVTYVNTTAAVKAEADVCCTSSNATRIVEALGCERVIFIPDEYLGSYVKSQTDVDIVLWEGHCEVHQRFTASQFRPYREEFPDVRILAHPECPPDVLAEADYVGSTLGMIEYVDRERPKHVAMITECSMSDNLAVEYPDVEFIRPCALCPHMQLITLPKILRALENRVHQVEIPGEVAERARNCVARMLELS